MAVISIIVPVYHVESYLRRCVDSILAQTFSDFELILVDDGSPDRCPFICDEYARQDSRVKVIHKENGGLSSARNAGMEIAQGEYMLFCDSDDSVSSTWCESLMSSVQARHDNYIFGTIQKVYEGKEPEQLVLEIENKDFTISDFLDLHIQSKAGFAWNVLYYTDVIRELGLRFRKDVIIEDLPFCLSYLEKMEKLTYCPQAVYFYLQRNTATLSRKYYQDGFRKWREKYAETQMFIQNKLSSEENTHAESLIAEYYLYFFLDSLKNTFDSRNTLSWIQKMRYNQKVVSSVEFQHCLHHCKGNNENQKIISLLKSRNYLLAHLYTYVANLKSNL